MVASIGTQSDQATPLISRSMVDGLQGVLKEEFVPFSLMRDPVDIARSLAAWEAAWDRIKRQQIPLLGSEESELARLQNIVGALAPLVLDEDELVERAIERFSGPQSVVGT